eukprot:295938-Chlamydomonas_euryale.AAC.4
MGPEPRMAHRLGPAGAVHGEHDAPGCLVHVDDHARLACVGAAPHRRRAKAVGGAQRGATSRVQRLRM